MPSRSRPRAHLTALAVAATLLLSAVATATAADPAAPDDELLVRFAPSTTVRQRADVRREQALTRVRESADGRTQVVVARGRATSTIRRALADDPRVLAVAPNARRELAVDPPLDPASDPPLDPASEPAFVNEWGLHNTGQTIDGTTSETGVADVDIDGLEALLAGTGDPDVVVAVIDDGVDLTHPELAGRAWTNPGEAGDKAANGIDDDTNGYIDDVHGWDFCNGDATVHDDGEDGHGTHVAGTIAASLDGTGVVGVAPGVRIMALKFIDDGWFCGRDDMAVAAIDYAASFGVRLINASWGGTEPSDVLDAAIADSGALLVAAAGNGGTNVDASGGVRFYPASSTLPNILAVGALDQRGALAPFSNYGTTTVDLLAPGTNILSTYPGGTYAWSAGTSMAAPHVAGVAALVASHVPSLLADPLAMRARLLASGRPIASAAGTTSSGRMVNALRAIDVSKPVAQPVDLTYVPAGTIIGSRSTVATAAWPAATDAESGISDYELRRFGPDGWRVLARDLVATSLRTPVRYGAAYQFRLRAADGVGNLSPYVDAPNVTATLHADGSPLARYGPGWRTTSSTGATGKVLHTATKAGAWMTFTFTGRSVSYVAPKGTSRGRVKVYVDGVYVKTLNLHRASPLSRVVVFARAWPTKGTHTVKLVVVGTARHPRVDVDAFVVFR